MPGLEATSIDFVIGLTQLGIELPTFRTGGLRSTDSATASGWLVGNRYKVRWHSLDQSTLIKCATISSISYLSFLEGLG